MKNILIIEDEDAAVRRLQKMILEIMPDANMLSSIESISAAVNFFNNNEPPHLIFLDVHLADGESFEIFKQVKVTSPVIFTTAYDKYALEAFKVNSIDYLLKPIKKEELQRAISKFDNLTKTSTSYIDINKLLLALNPVKTGYRQRFAVKYGDHIKTIETSEIAYFYTENKINFLITKENKRYSIDNNLDQLEQGLDPKNFFRINRQFIIGFYSIAEMFTYSKSRVLIKLNPACKIETIVSTERSSDFKAWLNGE